MKVWCRGVLSLWGLVLTAGPGRFAQPPGKAVELRAPQPVAAMSLEQLEHLARAENPILRRDLARIDAARGHTLQAGLYPNPRFDSGNPVAAVSSRESIFSVGVIQEIVVQGKLRLDREAAERQVKQAQLAFDEDRLALLTAVRRQFYVTLAGQRRVEVQANLLKVLTSALESIRLLQKAGETSKIEILLLSVDYRQIEMNSQRSRALLEGEYKKLAATVGVPGLVIPAVAGDLMLAPPEFDEGMLREYLTALHTSLRIAQLDVDRNNILLKRALVEPFPNIHTGPAYSVGNHAGTAQFDLNLTFSIPVWNLNQGNVQAARSNIRAVLEALGVLQNDLLHRGADALSRYRAARRVVEQYRTQILPQTAEILKLTQAGLKGGVFDFPRYLQAQRAVVETNSSYIDALEALWTSAAEVAGLLQKEHFP